VAASQKSHDALDQSRDVIAIQAHAADGHLTISRSDRQILRRLAGTVAELAARPLEEEKQKLWAQHNTLEGTRPLVFCDPENGWISRPTLPRRFIATSVFRGISPLIKAAAWMILVEISGRHSGVKGSAAARQVQVRLSLSME